MKQIISFEKEIAFKTMIGEVTSISLEHTLAFQGPSTIVQLPLLLLLLQQKLLL